VNRTGNGIFPYNDACTDSNITKKVLYRFRFEWNSLRKNCCSNKALH